MEVEAVAEAVAPGTYAPTMTKSGMEIWEAFVGNLSFDCIEDSLWTLFTPCGDLNHVKMLRGKAFVKFNTEAGLVKCLALNGTEVDGRRLRIEHAAKLSEPKPMSERDPESTTIFVGGISYYTNEESLGTVFADCGPIKDIRMPLNED